VVASCFDFSGRRNKVVFSDLNFPSVMYFWESTARRGARVDMVASDDGITVPTERLLKAIDEQTLLVPISHVIFRSSYINDAKAISNALTRWARTWCSITFQSLGAVPVRRASIERRFSCGGVLKVLAAAPATAYLYVRPDLGRKLEPTMTDGSRMKTHSPSRPGPYVTAIHPCAFMNAPPTYPGSTLPSRDSRSFAAPASRIFARNPSA